MGGSITGGNEICIDKAMEGCKFVCDVIAGTRAR
jgi:hypothetical protein